MRMLDGGRYDDKIIAIPFSDPNYNTITTIDDLPSHIFDEMLHFFKVYKQLERKDTDVRMLNGRVEAEKIVRSAIEQYNESFGKKED